MRMMKISSAFAVIAAALAVGVSSVAAGENGADVNHEAYCYVNFPEVFDVTYDAIRVDSASGNTVLSCHFRADGIVRGGVPSSVLRHTGFVCTVDNRPTTNSVFSLNPDGNGLLRCEIKPQE